MSGPWDTMVERLTVEQHNNEWWLARQRALFDDSPALCAQRLRDAMQESQEYEKRRRRARA